MISNSSFSVVLLLFITFLVKVNSHICLNDPPQRGGVPVDALQNVSVLCAEVVAPCGSNMSTPGASVQTYVVGNEISINVIKNEQHYNSESPGNFTVSYCTTNCADQANFHSFPNGVFTDHNTTTPGSLVFNVTLPTSVAIGSLVLQVTYEVSFDTAPWPIFYICADVTIENAAAGASNSDFWHKKLVANYNGEVVIIAIAIIVVVLVVVIILIIVIVKKVKSRDSGSQESNINTHKEENKAIPMMSMNQIQNNLMRTVNDPEQPDQGGYNQGGGGYNQGGGGYNQGGGGYNQGGGGYNQGGGVYNNQGAW